MVRRMLRPTPEQLSVLGGFERVAFEVADTVNRRPALKRVAHSFLRTVGREWVHACTRRLQKVYGMEHVAGLAPDRGVLLVSNHRSFFDLYVVSSVLLRNTDWIARMYFPVRSKYFYERPDGVVVNALMSAMAMYPPVMRDGPKRSFNRYAVDVVAELLGQRGTLVGYHPEGKRGSGADPYELLPAGIGTGEIIWHARPIVLPVFTLGLGNDLPRQVRGNFDGTGAPITVAFGAPLDVARFYAEPPGPKTFRRIAEQVGASLRDLGETERRHRHRDGLPRLGPARAEARVTSA